MPGQSISLGDMVSMAVLVVALKALLCWMLKTEALTHEGLPETEAVPGFY